MSMRQRIVAAKKRPAVRRVGRLLPARVRVAVRSQGLPFRAGCASGAVPSRSILVAAGARTGSTLLANGIEATGQAGHLLEWLLPSTMSGAAAQVGLPIPTHAERQRRGRARRRGDATWLEIWEIDPASLEPYIAEVVRRTVSSNGVFGAKLHWKEYVDAVAQGLDLAVFPQPISWVHIWRDDLVAQAVSLVRAEQSNEWKRTVGRAAPSTRFRYDAELIAKAVNSCREWNDNWQRFFDEHDLHPVTVSYEELSADYELTMRRVLAELSLDVDSIAPPTLERQADGQSLEWIARFRAE
jgi:LPS sulfotransferase NodH